MSFRRRASLVFAAVFVGIGVAIVVETAVLGGGVGYLIGALFVAAGLGRAWVLRRARP